MVPLIFLVILISQSTALEVQCTFVKYSFDGYNCKATNLRVDEPNVEVKKVIGQHVKDKTNLNVDVFYIPSTHCAKYLPKGVSEFLPNLKKVEVSEGSLKNISRNDFTGMNSLQTIDIRTNLLAALPGDTFNDLPRLEILILTDNRIANLEIKTFVKLTLLKKVWLTGNLLENLPAKLFDKNSKLEEVYLSKNRLRIIENFVDFKYLKVLELSDNFCISKRSPKDLSLNALSLEISIKCANDTEIVKSSMLTEMNHELLLLKRNVNTSSDSLKQLEENLMKSSLTIDYLRSEKRELINEVVDIQANLTIADERNYDLDSKLTEAYNAIRLLKITYDALEVNCSIIEKDYYRIIVDHQIEQQILRRNRTAMLEDAESSKVFIATAFAITAFVFVVLLITAVSMLLIIRLKRNVNEIEMKATEDADKL